MRLAGFSLELPGFLSKFRYSEEQQVNELYHKRKDVFIPR